MIARWKQAVVAASGVMFSITMFIALLGFMNGLNDLLDGLILNRTPHIRIYSETKVSEVQPINQTRKFSETHNFIHSLKPAFARQAIFNSTAIMKTVVSDHRVRGVTPKINTPLFFYSGTTEINGIISGIDETFESQLFSFSDYVTQGTSSDIMQIPNSIILGKGLAEKLVVTIGDRIYVATPQGSQLSLRVVGFIQTGIQELDKTQSYASLSTVQKILGKDSQYITDIQIKVNDIREAPSIANEYRKTFGTDTEDIQTANAQFETGSFVRTLISYAVGITLLIVAGFGIYNILNMMIYEKMDSIAILKATGFSGADVNRIFIFIALSIGITGGVMGLLFGFIASYGIDQIPFDTPALPTVTTYPVNYDLIFYLIGFLFSLVTTFLAGLFPAQKASRVDPVVIIRGK